jgi:ankyrin repeat protein
MLSSRALLVAAAAVLCASCGGPDPDDAHGQLIWAARHGDVATIRRLAASGVDLDSSARTPARIVFPDLDHRAWTALQHAAGKNQVEAVRLLLEWGADPDARQEGSTPLVIAATQKDPRAFQLLLDAGADVERARKMAEDDEANPLGRLIAYVLDLRPQSPKDAFARMPATPAQSRP